VSRRSASFCSSALLALVSISMTFDT
jgi:hypothetical protein